MEIQKATTSSNRERAVSPVIGVILLIGMTVILSATIAVAALEMAGDSQPEDTQPWAEDAPDADFTIESVGETAIITHDGGGEIDVNYLEIRGDLADSPVGWADAADDGDTVTDGDRVSVTLDLAGASATVGVVWTNPYQEETLERTMIQDD